MAKKVCEDIADLLLNERVKITISKSDTTADFVQSVLEKNQFLVKANEYQERKAYTGTVAYVAQIENANVRDDGTVTDGDIAINYVQAKNIFPITWQNGIVTEAAFVFPKVINRKKYAVIQIHRIEEINGRKQYVIENDVVKCTTGAGTQIPPEQWRIKRP